MDFIKALRRRLQFLLIRNRLYQELEEEIETHRSMKAAEDTPRAAEFGSATRWKEISREVCLGAWLDALVQDLRFGARQLRRNPGFTATIVISLALGLGATTAMFSLMNALLFKALPVPEPRRLITVSHGSADDHGPSMSYPSFLALRQGSQDVADAFAFASWREPLKSGPMEREIELGVVSGNFFSALQVKAQVGRLLDLNNDRRGGPEANAVILSDRLWRDDFQGNPDVIGKNVLLDGVPFVVIGVTPPGFFGVDPGTYPDATITAAGTAVLDSRSVMLECRQCNSVEVMARLRPGVSIARADSAMQVAWRSVLRDTASEDLSSLYRESLNGDRLYLDPGGTGPESYLRDTFVEPLYVMLGMSALILLAVCSNVANLLLARSGARRRELSIRLSTGASGVRIIQQFLTESAMLAILGLAAAAAVYQACLRGLLLFMQSNGEDIFLDTRPDLTMIGFTVGLTVFATLLFGLLPALRASHVAPRGALAESSQNASRKSKLGRGILVAQIAVSFTLLAGALLLARSLYELRHIDAGFRRDHLLNASPDLSKALPKPEDQERFARRMVSDIQALPGVRSASISTILPGSGEIWVERYLPEGQAAPSKNDAFCFLNYVSPRFFETMGTPLLAGRDFVPSDRQPKSPSSAIVSDSFAKHFWGSERAIGKRIHDVDGKQRITVIGVAGDARHHSFRDAAPRTVYLPFPPPALSGGRWGFHIEVWTKTNPESLLTAVRNAFHAENSSVPVKVNTLNALIDRRLIYERLLSAIAICFGALGLVIAAVGMFGVAAYSASRRTLEVGIRTALGATKPQIVGLFAREHLLLALAGLLAGVAGGLVLTRFLQTWLFGISSGDLPSFITASVILASATFIATLIPAVRAVQIEPWQALRRE